MAKFCPHCGKPVAEGMKFCSKCGTELPEIVEQQPVQQQPVQQQPVQQQPVQQQPVQQQLMQQPVEVSTIAASNVATDFDIRAMFFTTSGRLNRKPFLLRGMILCLIILLSSCMTVADTMILTIIGIFIMLICMVSSIMLCIRRLHDIDKSGWYILLNYIPIINIIFSIFVIFKVGTTGDNTFGPDPLINK